MAVERQHYVPRGYLKGFAIEDTENDNLIWAYEKMPDRRPRKVSVKSVCWEPYYYEQEKEDGYKDTDTIELTIAQNIENVVLPIIRNLNPVIGSPINLSEEDRGKVAYFLGLTLTRVPSFREPIRKFHTKIAQALWDRVTRADPKAREFLEKYGVFAEAKSWASLRPMADVADAISYSAIEKNWQFFVPPEGFSLVTSDNPVIFGTGLIHLSIEAGPAHPFAELVMNLRKDLALVCTPKKGFNQGAVFSLSPHEARKFNRGVVQAARRFVFCDHYSPKMDGFVKKYIGQEQTIVIDGRNLTTG